MGEPISINTRQTRTQMNIVPGWLSPPTPARNTTQFHPFNSKIGTQSESPTQKRVTTLDDVIQRAYQLTEVQTILKQNQSVSGPYPKIEGAGIPLQFISTDKLIILFQLINIFKTHKNVGFKGRICLDCLSCWVDPVCNNREDGMKSLLSEKPSIHKCDAERALMVSEYSLCDLENEKEQSLKGLTESLASLVSYIALFAMVSPKVTIYLNVEELGSAPQRPSPSSSRTSSSAELSSIEQDRMTSLGDIGRKAEKGEREQEKGQQLAPDIGSDCIDLGRMNSITDIDWVYRAINGHGKRSIVVNGVELLDFVATARATFRAFRVRTEDDNSYRYFLIYFSFR